MAHEAGLTGSRWELLEQAAAGPATVSRHARTLHLTRQSVQRTADLLVEQGLARFRSNPDHRRSPLLRLTPLGLDLAASLERKLAERLDTLASLVEAEDVAAAVLTLRALRDEIAAQI